MEKKVSLIVPIYNGQQYLPDCMRSLTEQSLRDIEILLIDDGSTDGTLRLCEEYAGQDSRIRVLHQENAGLGMTRNRGIDAAEGKYIGFVDVDDTIQPDMCEKMYQAAERTGADFVLAGIRHVGGNLFSAADRSLCEFEKEELFEGETGRKKLLFGIVGAEPWEAEDSRYNFSVCKNLYRRESIETSGVRFVSEREVISEDVIFLLQFVKHIRRAVGIPGAFYCYRRQEVSLTSAYRKDLMEQFLFLGEKIKQELNGYLEQEDMQRCTDRMLQARARVALVSEIQYGRSCGKGHREMKNRLGALSGTPELQRILRRYPIQKLPGKQALFAFAMRYRLTWLEYLLVYLKERR